MLCRASLITEIKTSEVLSIIDWTTKEKLDYWIWHFSLLNQYKKINWYNPYINKWYVQSLAEICGTPIWLVDKYYLGQEAKG